MSLFEGFHGFSRVEFVVGALDVAFQRVAARTTVRLDRMVVLVSLVCATFTSALAETRGVPLLAAYVACDVREILFDVTVLCLVARWLAWAELCAPLTCVGEGFAVRAEFRFLRSVRRPLLCRVCLLARRFRWFLAKLAKFLLVSDLVLSHGFVNRAFANKRRDDALRQVVGTDIVHDRLVEVDNALGERETDEVFVNLHSASGFLVLVADVLHVLIVRRVLLAWQLLNADHLLENSLPRCGRRLGLFDVAALVQRLAIANGDALLEVLGFSSDEFVQERVDLCVDLRINLVADVDWEDAELVDASGAVELLI